MAFESITIAVAGLTLQPVTFSLSMSQEDAARSFEAKVKHEIGQAALLAALTGSPACTIRTRAGDGSPGGEDLLLTGHVEKRSPRLAGEEKELTISGRSKTGDLVDSAAESKTGEFKGKKAPEVFGELAKPFGITIESDIAHKPFPFRLRPGETVFRAMERWARREGFTVTDTPEGNTKLAKEPKQRHAGAISDGASWPAIVDISAVHDDSKRHSAVKVKAQAPDGYGQDALEIEGEAKDGGIGRHRPRVIVPPEVVTREEARERAKWHRDRAAGKGVTCEVKLKGWRDEAGRMWSKGWLVFVEVADLGLAQEMMIESATFDQADAESGGTTSKLSLVDPRAYGGKKGKGDKSTKAWDVGKTGGDDA